MGTHRAVVAAAPVAASEAETVRDLKRVPLIQERRRRAGMRGPGPLWMAKVISVYKKIAKYPHTE